MNKALWKVALVLAPLTTAGFTVLFVVFFMSSFMEMSTLEAGNAKVEARVIEFHAESPGIKNVNPMQVTSVTYSFEVDGKTYIDSALGGERVGDVLSILYAKENPTISIPARVIVSEQKLFSGLAALLTLLVGTGLTVVVIRILWRKAFTLKSK